jgi:putative salt-induced outer membrane protein YdiY
MSARSTRPLRTVLVAAASLCLSATTTSAKATPYDPESYSRLNLSLGVNLFVGNLNQIDANLQGNYGLSSPTAGVDVRFNAYRLWGKPAPGKEFRVLGDDAYVNALPFWYFVNHGYVIGLASYETSQIRKVDHRVTLGAGVGYAPVRSKSFLLRAALVPAFEFSRHNEQDFRLDVPHDGGDRIVGRLGLTTNGWLRQKDGPVSFRYIMIVLPNVTDFRDVRFTFDGQLDVKIAEPLSFRVTQIVQVDSATVRSREPYDIRSTLGLVWSKK